MQRSTPTSMDCSHCLAARVVEQHRNAVSRGHTDTHVMKLGYQCVITLKCRQSVCHRKTKQFLCNMEASAAMHLMSENNSTVVHLQRKGQSLLVG